jgi:hypothetical protein
VAFGQVDPRLAHLVRMGWSAPVEKDLRLRGARAQVLSELLDLVPQGDWADARHDLTGVAVFDDAGGRAADQ